MAVFAYGFRPFFLLAGAYAALAVPVSLAAYLGFGDWPLDWSMEWPGGLWHAHEMVFGYAVAVVAGFLLTAVPEWRKTTPVAGPRLALLVAIWFAGRVAMWLAAVLPAWLVAAVDLAFLPALVALGVPTLLAAGAARNRIFLAILGLLLGANGLLHTAAITGGDGAAGAVLAVGVLALLITVLGGRIVPAFTANALAARGLREAVHTPAFAGGLAIATVAAMVAADLATSIWDAIAPVAGGLALAAAAANGWRMAGWGARHTLGQPVLWVLHLGYGWLVAGLALKGLAGLGLLEATVAFHGLTIGAVGTMTLAVMSRAGLGHTGRPVVVAPAIVAAYGLVSLAAAARLAAAVPELTVPALILAATAWSAAFATFTAVYFPILTRPRPDGQPG